MNPDEADYGRSVSRCGILEDHCRGGGVCIDCMDVDGVEDNGTASGEFVDAEIEGTVRFGGRGELFTPWDLQGRKEGGERRNSGKKIISRCGWMMEKGGQKVPRLKYPQRCTVKEIK